MIETLTYINSPQGAKVQNHVSNYQPQGKEKEIIEVAKDCVQRGDSILNHPFEEFNNVSMITRMNEDQRNWMAWQPEPSNDPEESWRWFGVRPITRNKIISTVAHLTQSLITPAIHAQNDQDEEDRTAGYIMGDLLEYNIQRSHYEQSFLYGVVSGLVNPVSYFEVKYERAMQRIWDDTEYVEVVDDELSGFQYGITRPEEILFDNPFQFYLQQQGFVARRREISYDEARAMYGDHDNWDYVQVGVRSVFCNEDNLFYDVEEEYKDGNVQEVVWMRRTDDMQVPFINGIYMGNPNVEYNPMAHRTAKNKPKYPWVKYGAEPIDAMSFFGYKSLAAKMANDQELVDRQWQLAMDGSFLQTLNPIITVGAGKVDKSVYVPATVTDLKRDAQIVPLNNSYNSAAALQALQEAERSISESSSEPQLAGRNDALPNTARQSILLQQNAETNLGFVARMIGVMVKEVGEFMIDDIIRYQTVGEMEELVGEVPRMKYLSFLVQNRVRDGKNKSHLIRFTDRFLGQSMDEKTKEREMMRLKTEAGDDREISEVNPEMFARLNFLVIINAEEMMQKNTAFDRAFKLEVYDKAIQNPLIQNDPEALNAVTRDFLLEPLMKGDASKYLPQQISNLIPSMPQGGESNGGNQLTSRLAQSVAMESARGGLAV